MIATNGEGVKYTDITPALKSDTFVNKEYKGAVVSNIRRYIEADNLEKLKAKAKERLSLIN